MTSPTHGMILLQDQGQFEQLIGRAPSNEKLPPISVVYFTANWCGACKRLDLAQLVGAYPMIAWWKCDIDQNDYTAGFCGIRSIPSFILIREKQILGTISNSDTKQVLTWIHNLLTT